MKTAVFDNEMVIVWHDWNRVASAMSERLRVNIESGKDVKKRLSLFGGNNNILHQYSSGLLSSKEYWTRIVQEAYALEPTEKRIQLASSALEELTTDASDEVVAILQELKRSGTRLVLLTNSTPEIMRGNTKRHNYFSLFDEKVISYERGTRKPHPAIYSYVLMEERGEKEYIYIDDKEENLFYPKNSLGWKTIRYSLKQPVSELRKAIRKVGFV